MSEADSRLSASTRVSEQVAAGRQATARTNPCSSSLYGCLVNSEGFKIRVVAGACGARSLASSDPNVESFEK